MANTYFYPRLLAPISGVFCDKTQIIPFTWEWDTDFTSYTISWVRIYIRDSLGSMVYVQEITGNATAYNLPANSIDAYGFCQWRLVVRLNSKTIESGYEMFKVQEEPPIATPISPKNAYINGEEPNTFAWSHSVSTGTDATRSDLQYSTNGSAWTDLATVTGSALTTTIPTNTFSAGRLYWRVRTYNANGVAGEWSAAAECYVLAPVPTPTILSVAINTARPLITWSAAIQSAFELDVLKSGAAIVKSGVVVTTSKSYKPADFLADGSYTARLRVYDGNGNYSEWATYEFTVSTTKPATPTLSVAKSGNDLVLTVSGVESGNMCYLLRDGKLISKAVSVGEDIVFTDDKTALEHAYVVRNVSPADTYSDSAEASTAPTVAGYVLSNSAGAVNLKFRTSITDNFSNIGGSAHYTGGEYPDFEFSEFSDNSFNLGFAIPRRHQSDLATLESIIKVKELTFVKSSHGDEMYCKVTGYSKNPTKHQTEVTISLTRVNQSEVIAYD